MIHTRKSLITVRNGSVDNLITPSVIYGRVTGIAMRFFLYYSTRAPSEMLVFKLVIRRSETIDACRIFNQSKLFSQNEIYVSSARYEGYYIFCGFFHG